VVATLKSFTGSQAIRVEVTASAPEAATLTVALVRAGEEWSGLLDNLIERTVYSLHAQAFDASNTLVYSAKVHDIVVLAGQTRMVSLTLTPPCVSSAPKVVLAAGYNHTVALHQDGTVWAWGKNKGQLGDGTETDRLVPVQTSGLTNITALAADKDESLALQQDGTVWAWGMRGVQRLIPERAVGLFNITALDNAWSHALALHQDCTVWAWGSNHSNQLGGGTASSLYRNNPFQVDGLTNFIALAAGASHTLALRQDGTVWAWGDNYAGQLGDGTTTNRTTPVQVSGLTDIIALAAGRFHSLALRKDGTVWAWGDNSSRQLGDGTFAQRAMPVQVIGLTNVAALSANGSHAVALRQDGTVWGWGSNVYGQAGGSPGNASLLAQVRGITDVTALATGETHTVALRKDGTVWAWGNNSDGQLGDGTTIWRTTPVQVTTLNLLK
jgi:alpha-tubulin suppressor-like RCC1 family protein